MENSALNEDIEAAWLHWKLGEKSKARKLVLPYLDNGVKSSELLTLGLMIRLDEENAKEATRLLKQLEEIQGPSKSLNEMKVSCFLLEENWKKAFDLLDSLIQQDKSNLNYRSDCAYILSQLKFWKRSRKEYEIILASVDSAASEKSNDRVKKDYRNVIDQSLNSVGTRFEYVHAPESLRQYITTQYAAAQISDQFRLEIEAFEELYKKPAVGDTASIREWVTGPRLKGKWHINEKVDMDLDWAIAHLDGDNFHEMGAAIDYRYRGFHSMVDYSHGQLIRSPLEGLNVEGRMDQLQVGNDYQLTPRVRIGHLSQVEWYRVKEDLNIVNGESSLGHRIINDGFFDFMLFNEPYISFNFHVKRSHWDKAFKEAHQVLDFVEDERVFYGGLYSEWDMSSSIKLFASATRSFDEKRNLYTTLTTTGFVFWINDSLKAAWDYAYNYNVNGTNGSGNEYVTTFALKWLF